MKYPCDIIRDLLPLYADSVCSPLSRSAVDEHLRECPDCVKELKKLQDSRIETELALEKEDVIGYGEKRLKRRSAAVGSILSSVFMVPVLVCLIVNLASGAGMGWFFIVLASLLVAASLILVPVYMERDKLFWTFCAFCASLVVLLAVICLVTGGNWFFVAAGGALLGLGLFGLPFVVRARPLAKWIPREERKRTVLLADLGLFLNLMAAVAFLVGRWFRGLLLFIGCLAVFGLIALGIVKKKGES